MSEIKTNENNVLRLTDITMQFGGVVAINNLSLDVNQGEIVALIGPNGAGKTTAFNCITGVYEPTNGAVYFHGKPIAVNHPQGKMVKQYAGINADKYKDRKPVVYTPDKITQMGIARTFQNIRLFKSQTAFENVLIGTHLSRYLSAKRDNRVQTRYTGCCPLHSIPPCPVPAPHPDRTGTDAFPCFQDIRSDRFAAVSAENPYRLSDPASGRYVGE